MADSVVDSGEITVTARKSVERLQDVPEAISVLTSVSIEKSGVSTIKDVANLVPNLTFDRQSTPGALNLSIRGISMAQGAEAPLAFVVDGVAVPDPVFIGQNLLDIQQIEVLRGPQGSLYGRNALAGAIIITSKKPTNDFAGQLTLRYGNGDDKYISGSISGPIVADKILFSLGASYDDFGGLQKNNFLNKNWDDRKDLDLRGRVIVQASEALTLDLRVSHSWYRDGTEGGTIVPRADFDNFDIGFVNFNAPVRTVIKLTDVSLKADLDLGDVTLTSISDLNRTRSVIRGDGDFSSFPAVLQDVHRPINAWSQEIRLTSNASANAPLSWIIGAFYQNRKTLNSLEIPLDNGFGQPSGAFAIRSHDLGRSKTWAVFGQANYKVLPQLEVTLGLRYDSDKRTSIDRDVPGSGIGNTFGKLQPKLSLSYHLSDDMQLYASAARGFRSGGFNAFFSVGGFNRQYGGQVNDNFEIGTKASLLDRRLFLTANLYHTRIKDQQLFFVNTNPPSQNLVTIDRSHVNGGELSLSGRVASGFNVNLNIGVADVTIDRFAPAPADKGNRAPIAPLYTAGINADYTVELGSGFSLISYASLSRRGPIYWDTANTLRTPPKEMLDARLTLAKESYSVTVYGRNLLDQQYPTQALANAFGPGVDLRATSAPRVYGVEMSVKF